jgi:amphi-Trp domain-containing protein
VEAFAVAAEARAFLQERGIDLTGVQQTKTKTALEYFAGELREAPPDDVVTGNERDVDKVYGKADTVAKLRRLAHALEEEKPYRIQIAGERIRVPAHAEFSIEHERGADSEEIEFQFTWTLAHGDGGDESDAEGGSPTQA